MGIPLKKKDGGKRDTECSVRVLDSCRRLWVPPGHGDSSPRLALGCPHQCHSLLEHPPPPHPAQALHPALPQAETLAVALHPSSASPGSLRAHRTGSPFPLALGFLLGILVTDPRTCRNCHPRHQRKPRQGACTGRSSLACTLCHQARPHEHCGKTSLPKGGLFCQGSVFFIHQGTKEEVPLLHVVLLVGEQPGGKAQEEKAGPKVRRCGCNWRPWCLVGHRTAP